MQRANTSEKGFYRGQKGLSLEISPKKGAEKGLPGPLGKKGPKKLEKESNMTIFQVFFLGFGSVLTLFRLFSSFFDREPLLLGRGLFDPCRRPTISQHF